ncbi:MAG: DUF2061 domain-containing protein [Haloferacaceae archaeon]
MLSHVSRGHPLLAKTVSYRVASVVTTVVVAYLLVGNLHAALDIGLVTSAIKMGVYYVHERAWAGVETSARVE